MCDVRADGKGEGSEEEPNNGIKCLRSHCSQVKDSAQLSVLTRCMEVIVIKRSKVVVTGVCLSLRAFCFHLSLPWLLVVFRKKSKKREGPGLSPPPPSIPLSCVTLGPLPL